MKNKKILFAIFSVGIVIVLLIGISLYSIYTGVKSICIDAREEFNEDCVDALVSYVASENHTLKERNKAIWALGQLADKRALPALLELKEFTYDGKKCSLDKNICQYEVNKAIKWCEKGNITSWMYRNIK